MNAEEFLQELEVPDRTISGRKPKGQITAYRSSLIELLESYHKAKVENLGLFDVSNCYGYSKISINGIVKVFFNGRDVSDQILPSGVDVDIFNKIPVIQLNDC